MRGTKTSRFKSDAPSMCYLKLCGWLRQVDIEMKLVFLQIHKTPSRKRSQIIKKEKSDIKKEDSDHPVRGVRPSRKTTPRTINVFQEQDTVSKDTVSTDTSSARTAARSSGISKLV